MLTRLAIKNFKSIGDPGIDLELKPLTLLVGPNGAGKSSVLEALALLAEDWSPDLGDLLIGKEQVNYDEVERIMHKADLGRQVVLYVQRSLEATEKPKLQRALASFVPRGDFVPNRVAYEYTFTPVRGRRSFSRNKLRAFIDDMDVQDDMAMSLMNNFAPLFKGPNDVYFLTAVRGVKAGPVGGTPAKWVGPNGQFIIQILNLLNKGENRIRKNNVQKWSYWVGISDISGFAEGNVQDADYEDTVLGSTLAYRSSSYGSRQVLPIVVQLFWSNPGSMILVEEPEISLHPQAQVEMAELLATAAKDGKQILATTHSTFLLLAIGKAIRAGIISADQVAIYEINKGPEGSEAKSLPIDEKGNIRGWADTEFGKVELALLSSWSKSLAEV